MTPKAVTLHCLMIKDRISGDAVSQAAMQSCSCSLDRGDTEQEVLQQPHIGSLSSQKTKGFN